jgi:hypothetical protein
MLGNNQDGKRTMNRSFANGNGSSDSGSAPDMTAKTQRDSGFIIRSESSWVTSGVLPVVV